MFARDGDALEQHPRRGNEKILIKWKLIEASLVVRFKSRLNE